MPPTSPWLLLIYARTLDLEDLVCRIHDDGGECIVSTRPDTGFLHIFVKYDPPKHVDLVQTYRVTQHDPLVIRITPDSRAEVIWHLVSLSGMVVNCDLWRPTPRLRLWEDFCPEPWVLGLAPVWSTVEDDGAEWRVQQCETVVRGLLQYNIQGQFCASPGSVDRDIVIHCGDESPGIGQVEGFMSNIVESDEVRTEGDFYGVETVLTTESNRVIVRTRPTADKLVDMMDDIRL
jgi:hypothetical protein